MRVTIQTRSRIRAVAAGKDALTAMDPASSALPADRMGAILAGLTPTQAEAAMLEGAILVLAGAGTGKTRTLTAGVAARIAVRGISPSRILAVTFTNKAAKEMADRIRTMLAGVAVPSWVGTFHGPAPASCALSPKLQRSDLALISSMSTTANAWLSAR